MPGCDLRGMGWEWFTIRFVVALRLVGEAAMV